MSSIRQFSIADAVKNFGLRESGRHEVGEQDGELKVADNYNFH